MLQYKMFSWPSLHIICVLYYIIILYVLKYRTIINGLLANRKSLSHIIHVIVFL